LRLLFLFILFIACDFKDVKDDSVVAKVGDYELRKSDLVNVLPTNISQIDSSQLVEKYISNWIINKSLFDKAEINLTKIEINEIKNSTNKYYEELIIDKYRSKLLANNYDTIIDYDEIQNYYNNNLGNFLLSNDIVKARYIKLNNKNYNIREIKRRFRRFNSDDKIFFDSISIQISNYFLSDSIWINSDLFFRKIPKLTQDEIKRIVKNNLYFVKEDSLDVYLIKVNDKKMVSEISPLAYIQDRLSEILLNKKKIKYLKKIEKELLENE
tara:strand:+ start:341 stop:1147 length:807 start_codon:yes stop_codon:yes gene_type:complete